MRKIVVTSLIIVIFLLCSLFLASYLFLYKEFSPLYDQRLTQQVLPNGACIQVYRNAGGGAMTGYSHAFFITDSCDKNIEGLAPFLNTEDAAYSIHVGDNVNINIEGRVYNSNKEELNQYDGNIVVTADIN
jgi:hypothetical protein